MKVGFIGLGRMGSAIAGNVLAAGHDMVVYNRSPEKAAPFGERGARVATTVAEACADREVVITMLAHDAALECDTLGPDGIVASLPQDAIHMPMGTHGVHIMRTLGEAHAEAGQILLAAPVLGRPDVAAEGQIGIVPAGPADAVARCQELFEVIGRRTFDGGTNPESAASMKVANNFVLGCAIEAMGEAFALVRKYGVDPEVFYDVMTDGLFAAPAYKVYGDIIAKEDYGRVGITAVLGLKDANLALAAGEAASVPLPSANVWRDRLIGAIARGDGDKDWAVMALDQARASGID
jgi:3-hydroxyisobutyrate dehydrogenase-like beta-hydroxyacid dehydrogenase